MIEKHLFLIYRKKLHIFQLELTFSFPSAYELLVLFMILKYGKILQIRFTKSLKRYIWSGVCGTHWLRRNAPPKYGTCDPHHLLDDRVCSIRCKFDHYARSHPPSVASHDNAHAEFSGRKLMLTLSSYLKECVFIPSRFVRQIDHPAQLQSMMLFCSNIQAYVGICIRP